MRTLAIVCTLAVSCVAIAGDANKRPPAESASSTSSTSKRSKTEPSPIADAWKKLPKKGSACAESDLDFDYGTDGGMRNFYCRARQVLPWATFKKLAPEPFRKGPHKPGGILDLHAERDFGYYDPAFVRWATDHLVPAADDETLRAATQKIYDAQAKNLARVYHLVDIVMTANPAWIESERRVYLGAVDASAEGGSWSNFELTDPYHELLGPAAKDWGGFDPNLVRASTMWWLRRHHDGTAPLWREGLTKLLVTYDAAWLKSAKAPKTAKLPKRAK